MPSVGMRRTTRVFGVVKGVKGLDGARVLRSGRRLLPDSGQRSLRGANGRDNEWSPLATNNSNKEENGWAHDGESKQQVIKVGRTLKSKVLDDGGDNGNSVDKMFGIVYTRKRKGELYGDKMFGIQFCRRQRRKESESCLIDDSWGLLSPKAFAADVVEGSGGGFSCFLNSILRYMRRERVELDKLAGFLLSQPISDAFSSQGFHFLWDPPIDRTGVCKFFGIRRSMPVFSVDFSAVPLCFLHMHFNMQMQFVLVNKLLGVHRTDEVMDESEEEEEEEKDQLCVPLEIVLSDSKVVAPEVDVSGNWPVLHPSVRAGRNSQNRNGLNSRSIQKRRSSLRRRKVRNPSFVGGHNAKGALVSDLISSRRNGIPFSSVVSKNKLRSSVRGSSAATFKEMSSTMVGLTEGVDSASCTANILIIESDKCYREGGVSVMLELSDSRDWLLVVKKDGLTRYTHKAEKDMRPPACNRFTHDIIWTVDDSWKLEFPNRQDWSIFKDLYKECSDRNVSASMGKFIPVPGVREVSGYDDVNSAPFRRPYYYISGIGDEVSRALAKRTANYDMDSEDEEWLNKFNNEFFAENKLHGLVSVDNFESMVDVFEKALYFGPDDFTDEKAAVNLCLDLGRREVVEAVFSYWMKKRKQKRSGLLRVFQGLQVKRTTPLPKPALRKRRTIKRQASQAGRGKQQNILEAIVAEQDAFDERNAMHKVEEAKVSENRSIESAILKRRRAQILMENADLATYKATMALRIAEAARLSESSDAAVAHFFD